jgi:2-oxo-4-hydroxy-4-carboxy-5-ureidoimidazoline decarboxylase
MSFPLTLDGFNGLPIKAAQAELERCCGSKRWVAEMIEARPFISQGALLDSAGRVWRRLSPADWQEAFSHHPQIGAQTGAAKSDSKLARTSDWASEEQKGTANASAQTLKKLADGNIAYQARFGYIFLVCATGKSAEEMLGLLEARMSNSPETELKIAAAEQEKITQIRLEKLFK